MKLSRLLLYIGIAILAFWVLGIVLKIAGWLLQVLLVVGLALVIAVLVSQYYESIKRNK